MEDLRRLDIEIRWYKQGMQLANLRVQPTLIERMKVAQGDDPQFQKIKDEVEAGSQLNFVFTRMGL